jgi:hypothetical protein
MTYEIEWCIWKLDCTFYPTSFELEKQDWFQVMSLP